MSKVITEVPHIKRTQSPDGIGNITIEAVGEYEETTAGEESKTRQADEKAKI